MFRIGFDNQTLDSISLTSDRRATIFFITMIACNAHRTRVLSAANVCAAARLSWCRVFFSRPVRRIDLTSQTRLAGWLGGGAFSRLCSTEGGGAYTGGPGPTTVLAKYEPYVEIGIRVQVLGKRRRFRLRRVFKYENFSFFLKLLSRVSNAFVWRTDRGGGSRSFSARKRL